MKIILIHDCLSKFSSFYNCKISSYEIIQIIHQSIFVLKDFSEMLGSKVCENVIFDLKIVMMMSNSCCSF